MDNLFTLADRLRKLREEKDAQAQYLKEINEAIEKIERELSDAMALSECSNFTRGDKQFVLTTTTKWSTEPERKDELYDELKSRGFEHLFTVNHQTLGSFVREQVEETADENGDTHVPDWLLGLVKSFDHVGITMKAVTKKQK